MYPLGLPLELQTTFDEFREWATTNGVCLKPEHNQCWGNYWYCWLAARESGIKEEQGRHDPE